MTLFPRFRRGSTSRELQPSSQARISYQSPTPVTSTLPTTKTFQTTEQINTISLTPDTTFLALGTNVPYNTPNYPSIQIYELATNTLQKSLITHKSSIRGLSITPDSAFLASCDNAGLILLTAFTNPETHSYLVGHRNRVEDIALDPTGVNLVSAGCDTTVRYWDCSTSKSLFTMRGHSAAVSAVSLVRHAYMVLSCGQDSALRAWDTRTAKQVFSLRPHIGHVTDCATDADGRVFVTCGDDRKCLVWDSRNLENPFRSFVAEDSLHGCDIAPMASRVIASGDTGIVRAWDVANGTPIPLHGHQPNARIRRCAISADGQTIATAGMDKQAFLFHLPSTPPYLEIATDHTPVVVMPEIERLFCNYVNSGVPLTTAAVIRAIEMDFSLERVKELSTIYVGHLCVRTLLSSGKSFFNAGVTNSLKRTNSFFYKKLYHKISEVVRTQRTLDYAEQILRDAAAVSIISEHDVNIILGDAQSNKYTRTMISELKEEMNDLYTEVNFRIATMESRLESLSFDVSSLRANVHNIETTMERASKVQRYANLIKFGLALIPFVGSAAMAIADGSANLIMSLDLESVVELFSGLFSTAGQAIVDAKTVGSGEASETNDMETEEKQAVQVVQYVLSDGFLNRMEATDRQDFVRGLELRFGGNLESLRNEVEQIVVEHAEVEVTEEISIEEVSPPVLIEHTKAQDESGESFVGEAILVAKFKSTVGESGKLSHQRACNLMKEVIESNIDHSVEDQDVNTLIDEALVAETNDKIYCKVDEECFVRSWKFIVTQLSMKGDDKWGKEFDEAADGDTEISCTVAVRMMGALIDECGGGLGVAQRIKALFKDRKVLTRDEFLQVARSFDRDMSGTLERR